MIATRNAVGVSYYCNRKFGIMFSLVSLSPFATAWVSGTATGLGLFAVVGAQRAFILRQGLMRAHLFSILLICALIDAIFILASVWGLQALAGWFHLLTEIGWASCREMVCKSV